MRNIKKYDTFLSEGAKVYYSAIDHWFDLPNFIKIEVEKTKNYSEGEVSEWREKYGLTDKSRLVWVTDNPKRGHKYKNTEFDEINLPTRGLTETYFTETDGFVIPESDDRGGYFLFVLK